MNLSDAVAANTLLELCNPLLESFVFFQELAPLHLYLIRVPHSCVDEVEAEVRAGSLLLNHGNILAKGLLGVLELSLQAFGFLFVHHLLVGLFVGDFAAKVLNFAVSFRLDPRYLLLFAGSPDLVEIAKQCVHQIFRDIGSAPVAEVMSHSEGLLWDPLVTVLISKTLSWIGSVRDLAWLLSTLLVWRRGLLSGVSSVHIADTNTTVDCKLREVAILGCLRQ